MVVFVFHLDSICVHSIKIKGTEEREGKTTGMVQAMQLPFYPSGGGVWLLISGPSCFPGATISLRGVSFQYLKLCFIRRGTKYKPATLSGAQAKKIKMFPTPEENRLCWPNVEFPHGTSCSTLGADLAHLCISSAPSLNPPS